jgi:sulfate transport system permease protein
LIWLACLLIVPLAALVVRAASLSPAAFAAAAWSARARAAYLLTFGTAAAAAAVASLLGLLLAWVLVRYRFVGRSFMDALVDLPLALPTAVAGMVYSALYVPNGWLGKWLHPLGFHGAHSRTAIVLVLTFLGLPFVVRTVQPVLESLDAELEEAAASLGATGWQTFRLVLLPALVPGLLTGFALAFARGLGEYGSVVFVSGNMPFKTEIAAVLVVSRLEEFAYAEATAIAVVLLVASLSSLWIINWLEQRSHAHAR